MSAKLDMISSLASAIGDGSMTLSAARSYLITTGPMTAERAEALISEGAGKGSWVIASGAVLSPKMAAGLSAPASCPSCSASEPAAGKSARTSDPKASLIKAVREQGGMYRQGALSLLMETGMGDGDADRLIDHQIQTGTLQSSEAGVLTASEPSGRHSAVACLSEPGLAAGEPGQRLTAAQRRALPKGAFAMPQKDGYPLDTAARAKSAMQRLNQYYAAGYYTDADYLRARSRILRAYEKFGITPNAPSLVVEQGRAELAAAAEPHHTGDRRMLSKAQKRAIALKNLKGAWAAQGIHGKTHARQAAEPGKGKGKGGKGKGKGKSHPSSGPKPKAAPARKPAPSSKPGRSGGKGKKPMSREKRKEIAMANLAKAWQSPKLGTPSPAPARGPSAPPARAAAPRPPSAGTGKGHKGGKHPRIPSGRYIDPRTGAMVKIQRMFPAHNPEAGIGEYIAAGTSFVVFLTGTDLFFRYWVTRAPTGQTKSLHGAQAAAAIRSNLGATPLLIGAGAAAVLGAAAYFGREYNYILFPAAAAAAGVGTRVVHAAITDVLLPLLFKAQSPSEETASNRLLADKQSWMQQGTTAALPPAGTTKTGEETTYYGGDGQEVAGEVALQSGPQWYPPNMPSMPAPSGSADVGPSAEVGVGCGTGTCGASNPGGYGGCPTCPQCGRAPAVGTRCGCRASAGAEAPAAVNLETARDASGAPTGQAMLVEGQGLSAGPSMAEVIRNRKFNPSLVRRATRAAYAS